MFQSMSLNERNLISLERYFLLRVTLRKEREKEINPHKLDREIKKNVEYVITLYKALTGNKF